MPELDPLTNLPKEEERDSPLPVNGKTDKKPDINRLLQASRNMSQFKGGTGTTVQGTFGEYGPSAMITSGKDFNEIRAQAQTFTELAGKTLAQTTGTVLGMGIESVGFLGDIPNAVAHMVNGSEMDFERNIISKGGNWIDEKTREMFPIYQTNAVRDGENSRFFDATYWAQNIPSIASTLSLMVPAGGLAMGASKIARALKLGKMGQQATATVAATLGSRHMEGMLEAYESFETDYQRALDNGFNEVEAKQFASESAANTYKLGYSNVLMDALQWGTLLRGFNFASRGVKQSISELGEQSGSKLMRSVASTLKKNPTLTVKEAVKKSGFTWRSYLAQSGMEGYEEYNQEFIKRLSSHNADIAMGLTEGSQLGFGEAIFSSFHGEHFTDAGTWDAALMGFLGGALFQGVGAVKARGFNRNQQEDQARRVKAEQEKLNYIDSVLKDIQVAVEKGDDITAQRKRESLIFNLAINGISNKNAEFDGSAIDGTLGNTKEMFEAIQHMEASDLQVMGLTEESRAEAKWALGELTNIEDKLNSYYNQTDTGTKHDASIAVMLAESSYRIEKGKEHLAELEGRIEREKVENPVINDALTPLKATQNRLVDLKSELEAKKKIYNDFKKAAEDPNPYGQAPFRIKAERKIRKETLDQLEQEMTEISQEISNMAPKKQRKKLLDFADMEFTPEIQDVGEEQTVDLKASDITQINNILDTYVGKESSLQGLYEQREMQKIENNETEKHHQNLLDPKKQQEVIESIRDSGKKLRTEAITRAIKTRHADGEYLNQEGRIFRVRHTEEGIELQEVDRDLEPVEGAEFKTITDPDRLENVFRAQPIDQVFSEEQFEAFREDFQTKMEEGDLATAFGIITDVLYRSNYGDRAVNAVKSYMVSFNKYINEVDSFDELIDTYNKIRDIFPGQEFQAMIQGELDVNLKNDIRRQVFERLFALNDQYQSEVDALNKTLDVKQKKLRQAEEKLSKLPERMESFKREKQQQIDAIFNELVQDESKGLIEDLDRRTKPAREIEALEQEIADQVEDMKDERKALKEQRAQLDKDIKLIKNLKAKLDTKTVPSHLLNTEIEDMQGVIDGIRTKLLLQSDMTEDQAETMQDRYEELEQGLETAITAIEKFRAYVDTIKASGDVLKRASHKAYNQLLDREILSGNETIFVGVGEQVFAEYRRLFNQALTEEIANREYIKNRPEIRKMLNENRLTSDIQGANVNYWATFAIDYPVQSDLFTSEEMQNVQETVRELAKYRKAVKDVETYQNVLKYLQREYDKKKISVKPQNLSTKSEVTSDDMDVERWENPQRTIFTAFTRPSGNSGTNFNPNSDASQRRYFRYVNKTDFEQEQHNFKIAKPEGQFEIELDLPEGYQREDVLLAIITDVDGKYLTEDGEALDNFDPEKALYSTMPLPTYDTLNEYGRTFTPSEQYLKKNFSGKNTEERLANYEKMKEQKLNEYRAQRDAWLEEIEQEGFAMQPIIGKSLGVPFQKENHHQYSEGAEPNPLSDVFENPMDLEMWVNTTGYEEHYGETVYMPKGHVVVRDPNTGNLSEAPVRQLNESEALTIINALKTYVRQSTLENGRFNQSEKQQEAAGQLRDKEGNILNKSALRLIQDYIYSFDKRQGKAPIEFLKTKQAKSIPGGRLKIGEQAFDLLATDPETGNKIKTINPELIDALRDYLDGRLFHVRSDLLTGEKSGQTFSKIEYKDGGFTSTSFESYKEFIVKDNVVGTWLQNAEETQMTVEEDGAVEPEAAYQFYNQQPIFELTNTESTAEQIQGEVIQSKDEIIEGETIYITPVDTTKPQIYEIKVKGNELTRSRIDDTEGAPDISVPDMLAGLDNAEWQYVQTKKAEKKTIKKPKTKKTSVKEDKAEYVAKNLGGQFTKEEVLEAVENRDSDDLTDRQESIIQTYDSVELEPLSETEQQADESLDDIIAEIKEKEGVEDIDIPADDYFDEGAPFQRRVTGGKKLTQKGFRDLSAKLQQATGIPSVHLNEKQALNFLEDLRERKYHKTKFTQETLPYGMYHEGVAYVFGPDISPETVFHEVAHAVVYQIMDQNPALANELIESLVQTREGRKIIEHVADNYPKAVVDNEITPSGVAEVITTAMGRSSQRQYLQKQEEYQSIINRILDAIRRFFRDIFGQDIRVNELSLDTTIDELSAMLVSGQTIQVTPNLVDTNFSKRPTILSTSKMVIPGRTVQFTQDALNMLDSRFFDQLFNKHPEKLATLFTPESNPGLYSDVMDGIYNGLFKKLKGGQAYLAKGGQGTETLSRTDIRQELLDIGYLLKNWDAVLDIHSRNLQKYNLEVISEETLETEVEKNTNRLWQEESIKFSSKQNATSSIRQLVGSLKSRNFNNTFPTMRQNVDFGKAFNLLANHMAGTTTLEQKKKILEDLQGEDGMKDLMNRLFSKGIEQMTKDDLATAMYMLEFNRTFSKHFAEYKLIFNDKSNVFKAIDATVNSGKKRLLQNWESSVLLRGDLYGIEDGRKTYKQEYFKEKYPNKYDEDGKLVEKFIITRDIELNNKYQQKLEEVQPKDKPRYRSYYRTLQFLEDLGIEITADVPADAKFNKAAQQTLRLIKAGETADIFAPDSNVSGNLDMFAQHQIDYAKDFVENQHQNINGETVYNVVLNHYVSLVQDKINNASTLEELREDMPHLFDTPYTEHSILLNRQHDKSKLYTKLFDGKGKRKEKSKKLSEQKNLQIDIAEGMKNKDQSVPFNHLSYGDKVQMALNSAISGRYSIFRAGDKKLERYMDLGDIFTNEQILNGDHNELFMEYLVDELKLIEDIQRRQEEGDSYKGEANANIENSILPALLATNGSLKSKMNSAIENGEVGALLVDNEFKRVAANTLNRYFDSQVEDAKEYIQQFFIVEKDGENFKNNGLLGLSENEGIEYTSDQLSAILKKAIINRAIANIEQTKLFTGHPVYYGGSDNFFHRMSGALGTKNISSVGHMENQILEKFFEQPRLYKYYDNVTSSWVTTTDYKEGYKPVLRTAVFKDPIVQTRYQQAIEDAGVPADVYNEMEESDAMGLISMDTYRDMKLRAGEWSQALERLYQWETRPEGADQVQARNWISGEIETIRETDLVNPDGSRTVFTMLKPQYFGPLAEEGFIPGMYKLAVMPVLPSYKGEAMQRLRDYMKESNTGLVTFETANKVGVKNLGQELYNKEGLPDFSQVTPQDSFYEYWGLQLQTGNKIKDNVTLGSQFMKQILSGIYNKGEAINSDLAESATEMWKAHNALIETGKQELIDELGLEVDNDGNYTVDSVESLISFLQNEATKREANNNIIDGLADLTDYIEGNLGLDVLSNRDKVENILASIADSRVISQKVHGGAKVQAASTFFEENPRTKVGNKWLSQNNLKFYEDGTMEVLMPHYFKELFGDRDASDVSEDLLRAIGFRIPTSGMNVIENIKIKGFLPQSAGEVIVLPSEIVAKAGSDFDVDKLNLLLPNYKIVDGTPQYIEYFSSAKEAGTYIQALSKELAERTGRTPKKGAIKTELRKRGYDKLADTLGKKLKNPSIQDLNTREAIQNRMIEVSSDILSNEGVQKNLFTPIGIDILEDIKKKVDKARGQATDEVGYTDMLFDFVYGAKITQRNVESIAGTGIAALHVSDHVHATRYNYFMSDKHEINLKYNKEGDNVSLGGKYSADGKHEIGNLLNQITNMFIDGVKNPISFSLNLNLETVGPALYLIRAGVPIEDVFNVLNQPIIRDYINLKRVNKSFVNREGNVMTSRDIGKKLTAKYGDTASTKPITSSKLKQNLQGKGKDFKQFQKQILGEYKAYEDSAAVLSEYVNATRIDTVAMGKNTSQLDLMLNSLEKIDQKKVGVRNSDKVLKDSENGFLAPHYKALKDFRKMFKPFFYHLNDNSAMNMYEDLISVVDAKKISMEDKVSILDKFKLDLMTYQILTNPVSIDGALVQPISERKDLMVGDNSLPKQILKIKQEGTDNRLLEYLMPIIGKEKINGQFFDNLKLVDQKLDVFEQNALIEAWRDLFFDRPQIARDLVQFTMLQNGLQLSPMTFTKFIPSEIYMEMINSAFENGMEINEDYFLEKFIENNYNDSNLVPTKWGTKSMQGQDIYKIFQLKEGMNEQKAKEAFKKGVFPYRPIPVIVVNKKGVPFGEDRVLFKDGKNFRPKGFKDYRNNRAYLSYGSDTPSEVTGEKQQLSEQQIESLKNRKSVNSREENKNMKDCS